MSRTSGRLAAALLAVAAAAALLPGCTSRAPDRRPNVVLIVTDDQSPDSLPHAPPVMPYLQGRMEDPSDHWVSFPSAFLNTPMCCPSRATLLTGLYSHHTGVRTNDDGRLFDESSTLATWLHGSGYFAGLFGKYLNGYPFGRGPYVPPGWDRWVAKMQQGPETVYYDYTLNEDGEAVPYGHEPRDYLTDVLGAGATDFIRTAPEGRPFFLEVTPTSPHEPWIPAPRDAGAYAGMPISDPRSVGEGDAADKPAWVRALPELSADAGAQLAQDRRREFEALLSVDDMVRTIVDALRERGALGNTVIFFLTDNGFSFGEHRWVGKSCEYGECVRTPFLVRYPGAPSHADPSLVSDVDVAPTIADVAGVRPGLAVDGRSLLPLLEGSSTGPWRAGVLLEWVGDEHVPPWWGVRTEDFAYVEIGAGERELYDLTDDPYELQNRSGDRAFKQIEARLVALLVKLRVG